MISNNFILVLFTVKVVLGQTNIIGDKLVNQLKDNAWYAASAFCDDQQLTEYKCNSCRVNGTIFIKSFDSSVLKTRGYLARNDIKQKLILAFRGTENDINALINIDAIFTPFDTLSNRKGNVHSGFLADMKSMAPQFLNQIKETQEKYPNYSFVITGHSLGAAIAALALEEIRTKFNIPDDKIQLFTYGQPKTGDAQFASWYNSQAYNHFRVVNNNDSIPHVQAQTLLGYQHYFHEIWLRGYDQNQQVLYCRDIRFEDPNCSVSIPQDQLDDNAHLTYFDTVFGTAAC